MSELEQKCYNKAIAFKLAYSCCFSLEENPPPTKSFITSTTDWLDYWSKQFGILKPFGR